MSTYENIKVVSESQQVVLFEEWGQMIADEITLDNECVGLAKEPGVDIKRCPTKAGKADEYQADLFYRWSSTDAEYAAFVAIERLTADCIGLKDEPGVYMGEFNSDFPVMESGKDAKVKADTCRDYMAVMFAEWYMADGGRKLYEIDDLRQYAIFERSYFKSLSKTKRDMYKKLYGRFCIVVADYFFDWINIWKYKQEPSPLARMWRDECGGIHNLQPQLLLLHDIDYVAKLFGRPCQPTDL